MNCQPTWNGSTAGEVRRCAEATRLPAALLRLPAVGDNAAMEAEPPEAEPPKRKRRWFQFSLRSLLAGVTLLTIPCSYVGWQADIVRERSTMRQRLLDKGACFFPGRSPGRYKPENSPSWLRRLLGDIDAPAIYLPSVCGIDDAEITATFPESELLDWIPIVG